MQHAGSYTGFADWAHFVQLTKKSQCTCISMLISSSCWVLAVTVNVSVYYYYPTNELSRFLVHISTRLWSSRCKSQWCFPPHQSCWGHCDPWECCHHLSSAVYGYINLYDCYNRIRQHAWLYGCIKCYICFPFSRWWPVHGCSEPSLIWTSTISTLHLLQLVPFFTVTQCTCDNLFGVSFTEYKSLVLVFCSASMVCSV